MTRDDGSALRTFIIAAIAATLLFTFITPPFRVPDEVGHFWRAASIAQGTIAPRTGGDGPAAAIPIGLKSIVYVFLWQPPSAPHEGKLQWSQFRTAKDVRLEPQRLVSVTFPAGYTPVAYAPQLLAALAGRATGALPLITFYLGRLLGAAGYILLVALAIRATPSLAWLFCAAGLLPMALYMAASWSPDAMAIGSSFLLIALLLRASAARGPLPAKEILTISAAGAVVGLAKPGYALLAALALALPASRPRRGAAAALIVLATLSGAAVSMWAESRSGGVPRRDVRVDPAAQVRCVRSEPLRFVRVAAAEFQHRGVDYAEQTVGRLGLLDVWLPAPVIWLETLSLLVAAMSAGGGVRWPQRLAAALVAVAILAGTALTLYVRWTPPCAAGIDGIQGRYFLPVVPLLGIAVAAPLFRDRRLPFAVVWIATATGIVGGAMAIAIRYYS